MYCIDRRGAITAKLFYEICANQSYSLHKLLPNKYQPSYSLREQRTFIRPKGKTERCKKGFLLSYIYSSWELYIPSGNFCSRSFSSEWNWFVQMVNAIPGRNLPVLSFAHHLPKPWTDQFAHVNGKQPKTQLASNWRVHWPYMENMV